MRHPVVLSAAMASTAMAADLPMALDFEDQTATRVHMTVAESPDNQREVEVGEIPPANAYQLEVLGRRV